IHHGPPLPSGQDLDQQPHQAAADRGAGASHVRADGGCPLLSREHRPRSRREDGAAHAHRPGQVLPRGPGGGPAGRFPAAPRLQREVRSRLGTLEMIELPRALAELGIDAELVLIGDKVQADPAAPDWAPAMQEALASISEGEVPGVSWLGGMDRASTIAEIRRADIGIGWRSHTLDSSLELSTKALEYSAAGTPPLLNAS